MRLTRKKAIALCIEVWTIHAETGCTKEELPEKHREIVNGCWFCEYAHQRKGKAINGSICNFCPYYKVHGHCYGYGSNKERKTKYFRLWVRARFPRTRKKYAKLFLGQIESLKGK
jgi:hypothetical protein